MSLHAITTFVFVVLTIISLAMAYQMGIINRIRDENLFSLKRRLPLILLFVFSISGYYYLFIEMIIRESEQFGSLPFALLGMLLHILWPLIVMKNIFDMVKEINELEDEVNIPNKTHPIIALLLYVYMIPGIVYIQIKINKVIRELKG